MKQNRGIDSGKVYHFSTQEFDKNNTKEHEKASVK